MFDAIELTHDGIVERLLTVRGRISLREAADAFVASTRRLDLRSALGSLAFASHFPDHRLAEETSTRRHICGLYGGPRAEREDLNVLPVRFPAGVHIG